MVKEYIVKLYKYKNWPEVDKVPYVNQLLQNNNIQCASMIAYESWDDSVVLPWMADLPI